MKGFREPHSSHRQALAAPPTRPESRRPRAISSINFLVGHVVPVVAASLVFKAVLDLSQGYSPLASIIAALFLLGVEGIWNLATGSWLQTGGQYEVTDMLMNAFGCLLSQSGQYEKTAKLGGRRFAMDLELA
jgi:hypothetical protein